MSWEGRSENVRYAEENMSGGRGGEYGGAGGQSDGGGRHEGGRGPPFDRQSTEGRKVFVGGIPFKWDDRDLREYFMRIGNVEYSKVARELPMRAVVTVWRPKCGGTSLTGS